MSGGDEGYSMILRFCLCSSYSSPCPGSDCCGISALNSPAKNGASLLSKVHRHNLSGSSLSLSQPEEASL